MATRRRKKKSLGGSGTTIQSAIKRPGALTSRAKRNKRTVNQQALHDKAHGGTLQKQQANFYLNTLKPIHKRRRKKSSK